MKYLIKYLLNTYELPKKYLHSETLKYTHFYDMKMGVFQCLRVYLKISTNVAQQVELAKKEPIQSYKINLHKTIQVNKTQKRLQMKIFN